MHREATTMLRNAAHGWDLSEVLPQLARGMALPPHAALECWQRCRGPLLSLQVLQRSDPAEMIEASGRHCVREDIRLEEKDHT